MVLVVKNPPANAEDVRDMGSRETYLLQGESRYPPNTATGMGNQSFISFSLSCQRI